MKVRVVSLRNLSRFTIAAAAAAMLFSTAVFAEQADGKKVFMDQKCNMCHSVSSAQIEATIKAEKMRGPDLAGVVKADNQSEMKDFLMQKTQIDGKKHPKKITSEDELNALVSWLQMQKK